MLTRPDPLAFVDDQLINISDMGDLVTRVSAALRCREGFTVFTLNLDHLVKRRASADFRAIYARASFVTADGWPVVALSRRAAPAIRRTTGADMVVPLCRSAAALGRPVAMFGTNEMVLAVAADRLRALAPGLVIALAEAPSVGLDPLGSEAEAAIARIEASGAALCFVALGAPKQEMFADRAAAATRGIGFVAIGAALDFIADARARAPSVLQRLHLEWMWRLLRDPGRLASRYAACLMLFARLLGSGAFRQRAPR